MNAPARIARPYEISDAEPIITVPCDECDGTGTICTVARVSGEAFDADWIETDCPDCDATGAIECSPCCPTCEEPLNAGDCDSCEASYTAAKYAPVAATHSGVGA